LAITTTGSPAGSSLAFFKVSSSPNNGPRQPKSDLKTGTKGTKQIGTIAVELGYRDSARRSCVHETSFRHHGPAGRASNLKEDFQQFWEYNSPTWAGNFLDFWCYQTMRSRIEPMKKIARTLRAHRPLLLNYFKAKKQFSSGVIEGLNNKAKVTMRRSYGFRTFRILELALYHSLGKLPEPELTHDFF
jgi:hypothetical protein